MRKLGIAVDLDFRKARIQRPGGNIAVAGRDSRILEAVTVAEKLVHLFARHIHVRPGNEDGTVLEPARTGREVEFRLRGVQHVPAHAGLDMALHENPVGGRVVSGEIGLHVVFPALEKHTARGFHDYAVLKTDELVGIERPGKLAARVHGLLTFRRRCRGGKTAQHGNHGQKQAKPGRGERKRKKHGIFRVARQRKRR